MKKKIIFLPPTYFYAVIVFIVGVYFLLPQLNYIAWPYNLLGLVILALGFYLVIRSWLNFKEHGTPEDFSESKALVTDGLYKYSRNPMYLGMVLILLGMAISLKNMLGFIAPVGFFLIIHFMFIPYEEGKNEKTFGPVFLDYKKRVRKWI